MEPVLEELSATVGESASVSVLDGNYIMYVARVHTRAIMQVGTRFAAVSSSMGRVLLANQDQVVIDRVSAEGNHALTPHTLTAEGILRAELEQVRE